MFFKDNELRIVLVEMKLVLESAEDFRRSVEAIAVLIDEAEFVVDENALSLKATDPSQISMVDFVLEKKAFEEYKVEGTARLGLDLDYLSQVMSRAKAKDQLVLELEKDESSLEIVLKGASTRSFRIPLIDVSNSNPPSPKIDFDALVVLDASVVQDALKDAVLVSSHVTVGVDAKHFFVKAFSSKGSLNNETPKDNKSILEMNAKQPCQAMFPLDYLNDMLKVASAESKVELNLKTNAPIRVSYPVGKATITYYLAPRIETE